MCESAILVRESHGSNARRFCAQTVTGAALHTVFIAEPIARSHARRRDGHVRGARCRTLCHGVEVSPSASEREVSELIAEAKRTGLKLRVRARAIRLQPPSTRPVASM